MENEIESLYKEIDSIILKHLMLNDNAMKLCQSWGYNGFKRLHRVNAKKMLCKHLELENCMFDKYRIVLKTEVKDTDFSASNIKYHLNQLRDLFYNDIKQLGQLNFKHIELIGVSNSIVEDVIKCFNHDYEKMCRWFKRFDESSWSSIDIHLVDDKLHEKMKEIEGS